MTWRDELQAASFRGVPFHVRRTEGEIGRRSVTHEYPLRDLPWTEDLGRRKRSFTVEALVIGPDYFKARDALRRAVEEPGPGILVHPYWGGMRVAISSCRVTETSQEGGMATFSLQFVEAGEMRHPSSRPDTRARVGTRATTARTALAKSFADRFRVAGLPAFVAASAAALVGQALTLLQGVAAPLGMAGAALSLFRREGSLLAASLASLVLAPSDLAASLLSLFQGAAAGAAAPSRVPRALAILTGWGDTLPAAPTLTPARQQEAANQSALARLVAGAALIEMVQATASVDFASLDEAVAMRDGLARTLDREMETAPDDLYAALAALRVEMIRDITARGADLARVVRYTPGATLPALVVAHRIHGDASREGEIVGRNRLRHPGFVSGAVPLEVLHAQG